MVFYEYIMVGFYGVFDLVNDVGNGFIFYVVFNI